jgi:hypothetical protein
MEHAKALRACDPNTTRIFMGRTFETLKETSFASVVTIRNREQKIVENPSMISEDFIARIAHEALYSS